MSRLPMVFVCLALSSPALANTCPSLWHEIDHKLKSAQLSEADRADALEHRKRGEELHNRAHHSESEAALKAALAKLG